MADQHTKWVVQRTKRENGHEPAGLETLLNELGKKGLEVSQILIDAHCFVVIAKAIDAKKK